MSVLNIILPVRISEDRLDLLDRLSYFTLDNEIPSDVTFTVVDDGSSKKNSQLISDKCKQLNIDYLKIDSEEEYFSVGRARNFAAQSVESKFIMFQDVDLMPYNGFYREALNECYVQKLDIYADRFVMFGVVYLTKSATQEYLSTSNELKKSQFLNYLIEDDKDKVEKFSTGTSVVIWRRDHYLCTGGNDPEFEGWGFEDLEYTCRAIRRNRKFPLPNLFPLDYKNFMTVQEYKGWKSVYRLYGDITFVKGMVLFHSWHPIDKNSSYISKKENNKKLFEKKLMQFSKQGTEPLSLPKVSKGKSLMFRSNPWTLNRWIAPNLGEIIIIDEDRFDSNLLMNFIKENDISRVVFHNPYATEKSLELYECIRENNFPYIVCERGALRDSVFLDPNGFNSDSSSYSPDLWNKDISLKNRDIVLEYIRNEKSISNSLEIQNLKINKTELRSKIGISEGKKILFIPLQRPTDTVIKYFSGDIGSFDNFISLISGLSHMLPQDWEIVLKKHPLEINVPEVKGVYYANEENIKSLIDLSDAVLLINSGVGVLSMIYGKPVLVAGDAFYKHEGLCYPVKCLEDVLEGLNYKQDSEKVLKFLSYLINEFYSFGKFQTRLVDWIDGSKMTATTGIEYYCVRFPGEEEMLIERSDKPYIKTTSILFDRYRDANNNIVLGEIESKNKLKVVKSGVVKGEVKHTYKSKNNNIKSPFIRKLRKLKRDPSLFLRDTKYPLLKSLGEIIK